MNDLSPDLLAALAPLAIIAIGFVAWCWISILRGPVRHMPPWAWLIVVTISIPVGGIVYVLAGRGEELAGEAGVDR